MPEWQNNHQNSVKAVERRMSLLSRATSHGAPWLRWPEDGRGGNGGTNDVSTTPPSARPQQQGKALPRGRDNISHLYIGLSIHNVSIFFQHFFSLTCLYVYKPCNKVILWKMIQNLGLSCYVRTSCDVTAWLHIVMWHHKMMSYGQKDFKHARCGRCMNA